MPTSIALFLISSLSVPTLFFPPFLPFSILTLTFFSSHSLFFHRILSFTLSSFAPSVIPIHFLPHTLPPSRSPSLSRLPLFLSFPLSLSVLIVFVLETIQIPSVMLELQKPGQSAATSEAPGIAARYSANTTTTKPLHESNS